MVSFATLLLPQFISIDENKKPKFCVQMFYVKFKHKLCFQTTFFVHCWIQQIYECITLKNRSKRWFEFEFTLRRLDEIVHFLLDSDYLHY